VLEQRTTRCNPAQHPATVAARCNRQAPALQRGDVLFCLFQVRNLKVGPGIAADTDIGPVISRESKERIERLIQSAIDQVSHAAWFPSRTGIPRGMVSLAAWYPTSAW
jgi:hypothetical protein